MVTLDEFLEVCVRHSHDDWIYTGSAARAVLLIDAGLKSGAYFKDVDVLSLEPGAGHTEVTEEGVLIDVYPATNCFDTITTTADDMRANHSKPVTIEGIEIVVATPEFQAASLLCARMYTSGVLEKSVSAYEELAQLDLDLGGVVLALSKVNELRGMDPNFIREVYSELQTCYEQTGQRNILAAFREGSIFTIYTKLTPDDREVLLESIVDKSQAASFDSVAYFTKGLKLALEYTTSPDSTNNVFRFMMDYSLGHNGEGVYDVGVGFSWALRHDDGHNGLVDKMIAYAKDHTPPEVKLLGSGLGHVLEKIEPGDREVICQAVFDLAGRGGYDGPELAQRGIQANRSASSADPAFRTEQALATLNAPLVAVSQPYMGGTSFGEFL
ncbi:MAG: hypothetical protein QF824_05930 [Candidatus Woesearchaeota archaeon]|jgi:hypothetical protein|nr:hypothetical protein [Candidatus Woesearchaeota archaeon]